MRTLKNRVAINKAKVVPDKPKRIWIVGSRADCIFVTASLTG